MQQIEITDTNRKAKPIFRLLNWSNFQVVSRLFVLLFEDEAQRTSYNRYYFLTIEIENYNIMINGQKNFDQPVRNNLSQSFS